MTAGFTSTCLETGVNDHPVTPTLCWLSRQGLYYKSVATQIRDDAGFALIPYNGWKRFSTKDQIFAASHSKSSKHHAVNHVGSGFTYSNMKNIYIVDILSFRLIIIYRLFGFSYLMELFIWMTNHHSVMLMTTVICGIGVHWHCLCDCFAQHQVRKQSLLQLTRYCFKRKGESSVTH